jgi:RHS repeat-associated protein
MNLRFPGQYYDEELNMNYNYFRHYQPETGRYIQSDPLGIAGGVNGYEYGINNPLMMIDPLGLAASSFCTSAFQFAGNVLGGIAGAIGGFFGGAAVGAATGFVACSVTVAGTLVCTPVGAIIGAGTGTIVGGAVGMEAGGSARLNGL